jgi:phosphoglycolate phosphatase
VSDPPPFLAQRVRAVVFDLDGTLVDSYRPIAASLNHARDRFGMPPLDEQAVRMGVGRGLECLIAEHVGADRVLAGVRLFREHYARVYPDDTVALPGVRETLQAMRDAGYRMAVASNKPARFSVPIVEQLGLAEFLCCVLGPDVVRSHKPEPIMIRRCVEILGVSRAETVYVGDMVLDVEAAARAGVPVLLVAGGSSTREELVRTGQTLLPSLASLPPTLAAGPAAGGAPPDVSSV